MTRTKGDSLFVHFLGWFFGTCADLVCSYAWLCIIVSTALSALGAVKIPLSHLSNKISDFTPLDAPSYKEYQAYSNFYENGVTPNTIYAFVTGKGDGNMLRVQRMEEAVGVMDTIATKFKMNTIRGPLAYEEFCRAFCVINEPVRTFYNGLRMRDQLKELDGGLNDTATVDVSYPDTTVLGVRMHLDPNTFGAEIAVERNGTTVIVHPLDAPELNQGIHLNNNLRGFKLLVLNFKAELGPDMKRKDVEEWEQSIVRYYTKEFKSSEINVNIFAESFLTSEVVRAGLTLLPFLLIGYIIMIIFSASTFSISALALGQMSYDKMFLAVMASTTPFMACAAGLGMMFWCGIRFGSILCVTPFLILAIGVDDAYLMVNAWQQITSSRIKKSIRSLDQEEELRIRMREMCIETGPSIAITTITNVCAFMISAISGSPEVQLFSVGNAICVLMAFIFQLTIYGSIMVLTGRREITKEFNAKENAAMASEKKSSFLSVDSVEWSARKEQGAAAMHSVLRSYCVFITRWPVALLICLILAAYLIFSGIYTSRIQPELRPEKLFLHDSPFTKLFADRQEYLIPHYSVAWIFVENPGDIWEPKRRAEVENMVHDFESMPSSIGHYSTKFFLRDFEDFAKANPDLISIDVFDEVGDGTTTEMPSMYTQLQNFLSWPENSYWKGFVQFEQIPEDDSKANRTDPRMTRFMLTTAYQGQHLKEWSNRVTLLKEWRAMAHKYPDLNISVYQDDSKFLDVIDAMAPQAIQSALLTIASMFVVTLLFIPQPLVLCTATFTIFSTSLGVFGIMTWMGAELDPIFMTSMVMSIGFSVDIPAHIAYHYHQTGAHSSNVVDRLQHTITRVGFPIMQASLSTILCVSSLFFIDLHMSRIFATSMLMVVSLGTIHGLLVMPVIFGLSTFFSRKGVVPITPSSPSDASRSESTTTILTIS